ARRSGLPRWVMIVAGAAVVIVLAFIAISALSGGGGGSGPTAEDVAGSANFYHGSSQGMEILRKERCKLTDLDRSRGYTKKWIVSYRKLNDDWIITDPFVYDGYQWDDYFAQNSNTGCPNIE
ncbi:MAG: hypothetical protein HGA53_09575, partial [Anaerolineaceae bacterium]|nr:hypothetical protein [Anaerolineaceae bacterium]